MKNNPLLFCCQAGSRFQVGPYAIALRPVAEADGELLYQIYAGTREDELAQTNWPDAQKEQFLRMQFHAQSTCYRRDYEGAEFLVIMVDGVNAGRLYLQRRPAQIGVIDIALLKPFQRKGIGGMLLGNIIEEAGAMNVSVMIHVEFFNPAQNLYKRLGFVPVETNQVYIRMEWHPPQSL